MRHHPNVQAPRRTGAFTLDSAPALCHRYARLVLDGDAMVRGESRLSTAAGRALFSIGRIDALRAVGNF